MSSQSSQVKRPATSSIAEFALIGSDILESEDLTDKVARVFLSVMAKEYVAANDATGVLTGDLASLLQRGIYLPCSPRLALTRSIDIRNDGRPDYAAIAWFPADEDNCEILQAYNLAAGLGDPGEEQQALKSYRRALGTPIKGTWYRCCSWSRSNMRTRSLPKRHRDKDYLSMLDHFMVIAENDRTHQCVHSGWQPRWLNYHNALFTSAINIWSDRKHLWNVTTKEQVWHAEIATPLILGVDEEYIKSLFYARELPLTETGRRRPILHWVRAHQRRLKEGLEIDVRRHLRGIERFSMHGFEFEITQPRKVVSETSS